MRFTKFYPLLRYYNEGERQTIALFFSADRHTYVMCGGRFHSTLKLQTTEVGWLL